MRKKKILIHSNFCKAFTGFGKHKKNLLKYLYQTDKYDIVELVNAKKEKDEALSLLPWKAIGTLPEDPLVLQQISKDKTRYRNAGYGHESIQNIIKKEKPDIYLGIEDVWAFSGFTEKDWWSKINCIVHTTLDSLPLLPDAVKMAPKIKNYYVWASFAEKAMAELGHEHVKTIRGTLDTDNFYKINDQKRQALRRKFNISDDFIIGFVFRNQLRKSVPNLLEGFKLFKSKNPSSKAKLLLHTHWAEGWDIPRLIKEKGIKNEDVLTTYYCKICKQYVVSFFSGQKRPCPYCSSKDSLETTNIANGVNEVQLNEIYNLMDVYCHPFTSGGQEIPIQEAKLTELITLVTNYSCGEDLCTTESGGLALDWAEYREPGTQFIKASTNSNSICKQLTKVFKMKPSARKKAGKAARKFVIDNFSIEVVGKQFEDIFDGFDFVDWDNISVDDFKLRDSEYAPNDNLPLKDWLIDLYKNCLRMEVDENDSGYKYWASEISKGKSKSQVLDYFHKTAKKENIEGEAKSLDDIIDRDRPNKRIAYVMPEHGEDILASTSIVKSLKNNYPNHDIYFFTKKMYYDLIDHCNSIYKMCEYKEEMDLDCFYFIGRANKKGLFDLAFFPYKETKKSIDYANHGRTKIEYQLR
jgi:glycosyltransferase involved in cell wall biosynthesis